jgi:3-hydroxybutyryl-CoA dehydrogenase
VTAREAPGDPIAQVVGVVGAGTMGAGIAQLALTAGNEVVLHDVDDEAIERGRRRIGDGLARLAERGRLSAEDADGALRRLREAHDLAAVGAEADIVIEAALEEIGLKQRIFRALDAAAAPATVLATNTSALSVGTIAQGAAEHPERVVGLHFFNPAPAMALVEVVAPASSDEVAVERADAFARSLGKTTVRCGDAPGFIVNRVNRPFTLEALRMLEAAESDVVAIDRAIVGAGFPMGPFALMDLVGIDVNLAVARALWEAFGRPVRFQPSPIQEMLLAAGHLGRKSGEGFYRYDGEGRPQGPARGFSDMAASSGVLRDDEIVERIAAAILNEAHWALGDGVAGEAAIDLAMRLGASHPWGPFERTAALGGRAALADRLRSLELRLGERFAAAPLLAADGGGA